MTDAELEELPVHEGTADQDCAICFCKISESKSRDLPCSHVFHEACIFPWLKSQPSCPMCRHKLKDNYGERSLIKKLNF
jgi:hypothetical protein